jgi:hypothetical protein
MLDDLSAREALVRKHVSGGRRIIKKQRELIRRIRATGRDCEGSEALLAQFETSLAIFEQDLADLIERD